MIEIITDSKLITKYQHQFTKQLKTVCKEKVVCVLGYQGYSEDATTYYSEKYKFWFTSSENNNRYWNAFGSGRPEEGRNTSITVEINLPYEGINRHIGGVFGHNKKGEVLVLHRGKIGGGRVGVGKQLFFNNYRDKPIIADDDGIETEFCQIGALNARFFPRQIANFVSEVHRIKNLKQEEVKYFSFLNNFSFTDEATGNRKVKRSGTTVIERTHGIVVNLLSRILESKGYEIAKDRNIDLFIHDKGKINTIFEIKRSSSSQDLYSAVGQLLIYSIPIKTRVDLILVLPEKLKQTVENRLNNLGMKVLYYGWNDGEPLFQNLEKFL